MMSRRAPYLSPLTKLPQLQLCSNPDLFPRIAAFYSSKTSDLKDFASNNTRTYVTTGVATELSEVKSFAEIPKIPIWTSLFSFLKTVILGPQENGPVLIQEGFKRMNSPIYAASIGKHNYVFMKDVDAVEHMLRNEGKYPRRIIMDAWKHWREGDDNYTGGVLTKYV